MVVGRRLSAAAAGVFVLRKRDEAIRNDVVDVVDADGGLLWTQGKKTLSKRKKTLSTLLCGKGRKQECIVVVA